MNVIFMVVKHMVCLAIVDGYYSINNDSNVVFQTGNQTFFTTDWQLVFTYHQHGDDWGDGHSPSESPTWFFPTY